MKKIIYCTPSLYIPGGMERVLTTKANYLAEVGYDITIVLTDGKGKAPYYPLSPKVKLIQLDIRFEELWHLPFHKKVWTYLKKQRIYKKQLTATLMEQKPDITVSLMRREINFLTSIQDGSRKVGEIHVNKAHYRNFEQGDANFIKNLFAKWWIHSLEKKIKKLDKFVVLTEEDRQSWKGMDNVITIPNPLSYLPEKRAILEKKQAISVGRFSHEKGFDMLIECWKEVYQKHPDWILKIIGTDNVKNLTPLIQKADLEGIVIPMEPTPHIYQAYMESSVYLCSSRFEGFGMTIVEAMSCGMPCVSFDCEHGPRNIITHGQNGYLVEPNNIESLARHICLLIEDEEKRKEMGKAARKRAEDFSEKKIMKKWIDLFENIS